MPWRTLKLGAGGQVLGVDAVGSTFVCWTDVSGAYKWNATTSQWDQIVTAASMPSTDYGTNKSLNGVWAVAIAPSNANVMYMGFTPGALSGSNPGYIFKSTDGGSTWARTALTSSHIDGNFYTNKFQSPKIAIDPANADVVIVGIGSQDGSSQVAAKMTVDGGANWTNVPSIPATTGKPACGICFDPSSAVSGSPARTQGIYIASSGNGVYRSTNAATSFSLISAGDAYNTDIPHGRCASDGVYYFTGFTDFASRVGGTIYKITTGTVANIKTGNISAINCESVIVSPHSAAKVIVMGEGGTQVLSTDRGANWTVGGTKTRSASAANVPWLGWANEAYMTVGDAIEDPLVADKIWFAQGIGTWTSVATTPSTMNQYTSNSAGIEELVTHQIISPPGGYPLVACSDRAVFTITDPNAYPATHGPNADIAIQYGSGLDWASSDPSFIVLMDTWNVGGTNNGKNSSYSSNKGVVWSLIPSRVFSDPSVNPSGTCAASTTTNFVFIPAGRSNVWNTKDGGTNWTERGTSAFTTNGVTPTGIPTYDGGITDTGWPWAYYLNAQVVCADRVNSGYFYAHNWNASGSGGGIYRSTDGGDSWIRRSTFFALGGGHNAPSHARLKSVPNLAGAGTGGHLFFTAGENESDGLWYSVDGGSNWTKAANTNQVLCFGCGAVKAGNDYPSVYIVGEVSSVYGIWRSDNSKAQWAANSVTWTNIGTWPLNSFAVPVTIEGDHDVWGRAYLGTNNNGAYFFSEDAAAAQVRGFSVVHDNGRRRNRMISY